MHNQQKELTMKNVRMILAAALAVCLISLTSLTTFAAGEGPMVDGTVTEVRPGGELTIKHGPLPNLDMPAMTMVFKLNDPAMGKGVKKGDKIKMHVEDVGGKLTIMHLKK